MIKKFLLLAIFFALVFPRDVQAARSMIIVSDKSSLLGDEEMVITASPSGFIDGETIYVKGAFYQDMPTPNYFGYTQKGDSWVKNSQTTTDQLSVKIGEWSNALKVKSDFLDSGYKGEGDYKFKVGFYYTTSGGSLSSVQWSSNILAINLNEPDPTPTPTPTPTLEPTVTPQPTDTPTPQPPTSTPVPTSTKIPTSSLKPTPTQTPTPTLSAEESSISSFSSEVLGESEEKLTPTPSTGRNKKSGKLFSFIAIILGLGFIGASGYFFFKSPALKK